MKTCFLFIIVLLFLFTACSAPYAESEESLPTTTSLIDSQVITKTSIFKKCCVENDSLKIEYTLSKKDSVEIKIYSICGREVDTLVDENEVIAGDYYITWNSNDSSGIYLCRIKVGKESEIKKIIFF